MNRDYDLTDLERAQDKLKTFTRDFASWVEREKEKQSYGLIQARDEAVIRAHRAGVSKARIARAMNISSRHAVYDILAKYEGGDFDTSGSITSEFDPDSNTVSVRAERLALTEDEYASVPAAGNEPVTLEATFDVSLLADGTPYYFPVDDDFTPLTVQFAKILSRYI